MKIINNLQDFANYIGARDATERSLGHAIYKGTACGAWVSVINPGEIQTGSRHVKVRVSGTPTINGWLIHTVSVNGKRVYSLPDRKTSGLHPCIASYCAAEGSKDPYGNLIYRVNDPDAKAAIKRLSRQWRFRQVFTVEIDLPVFSKHNGGVVIGSIVEGSDAEVGPSTLYFPFRAKDFDSAIENIEDEADILWREANVDEEAAR